jgi:hypothetical protein
VISLLLYALSGAATGLILWAGLWALDRLLQLAADLITNQSR